MLAASRGDACVAPTRTSHVPCIEAQRSVRSATMAGRSFDPLLTRRQLMQSALLASSVCVLPRWVRAGTGPVPPPSGFLQDSELALLDALTARIIPAEDTVGAHDAQ